MKTYKIVNKSVEDKVYCDICNKCCTNDNYGTEYATLEAVWTYGSKYDGLKFDNQLCENCFYDTIRWMKEKRKEYLDMNKDNVIDPFTGNDYSLLG